MARLPNPGGDPGNWGTILNDYLSVAHNADGTLKNGAVSAAKLSTPGAPTSGQILSYDGSNLAWTSTGSGSDPAMGGDLSGTASNAQIVAGAVTTTKVADGAVDFSKLADGAVDTVKLNNDAVTEAKIANGSVTSAKIAAGSVDDTKLSVPTLPANGQFLSYNGVGLEWSVPAAPPSDPTMGGDLSGTASNAQLVAGTVGNAELAAGAVSTPKVVNGAITTDKLFDSSVTASKLAGNAVATASIQDSAVTEAKLAPAVQTKINSTSNSVTVAAAGTAAGTRPAINFVEGTNVTLTATDDVANNRVNVSISSSGTGGTADASTTAKGIVQLAGDLSGTADAPAIAASAITSTKIADANVTTVKLASAAVTTDKLADASVTNAKLASDSVSEDKLVVNNSPTTGQVLSFDGADLTWVNGATNPAMGGDLVGTASDAQIRAGAVTANELAAAAVTTSKVADLNVTQIKLAANAVSTPKIVAGAVTTDKIANAAVTSAKLDIANTPTTGQVLSFDGIDMVWSNTAGNPTLGGDLTGTASDAQIAAAAVGAAELAANAVTSSKVLDGAVTTTKVADGAITEAKLDTAVQTKINSTNNSVTVAKAGADISTRPKINLIEGTNVSISAIDDAANNRVNVSISASGTSGAVDASTTTKGIVQLAGDLTGTAAAPAVATSAITAGKIAAAAVTTAKVADGAVSTAKVADGAITEPKLGVANLPTTGHVLTYDGTGLSWAASTSSALGGDLSGSIGNAQIVAGAVGAIELAANSVTAAKITDGAVTDAKISANGISQAKVVGLAASLAEKSDTAHTHTLASLSNVADTAPTTGQVLKWNGTAWAPAADSTGTGGGTEADIRDLVVGTDFVANNDTTLGVITGLSVPVAAGEAWHISGEIIFTASQTADAKFAFGAPTGATIIGRMTGVAASGTVPQGVHTSVPITSASSVAVFGGFGVSTNSVVTINARATLPAAANLTLRFAQNVAEVSDATVQAGSWLLLAKAGA